MEPIYHLVLPAVWEEAPEQDYRPASLASEGFIHCSRRDQVVRSANRFYAEATDLLLLTIDPVRLTSPLKYEAASNGELFPHIHGSLNRSAVVAVGAMRPGATGWSLPERLS